ncbi:MAG: hypothetical protein BZY68_01105 [SAR202 cluster bacterium MP-SAtl-SRR3965592-G2]|jgi:hypothetical protein|nr:MAG: hypothetical protein BZY68_01105 [SAR202 cluster bacterium MP-SAtl-SRR3965592-G2]HIM79679.1 hypothetical protein [Dehalococcoidia bacterium]
MSSFSLVLVEEGVEVEIPGDLTSVVSLLDEEVPWFSHAGHEYQLTPGRTELGVRWDLSIKLINSVHRDRDRPTVGHIELEAQDPGEVVFRIPPRNRENFAEYSEFDPAGNFLGSFIFQTLNMLQKKELITLPGPLPTS